VLAAAKYPLELDVPAMPTTGSGELTPYPKSVFLKMEYYYRVEKSLDQHRRDIGTSSVRRC
jgi:hypothetical protein